MSIKWPSLALLALTAGCAGYVPVVNPIPPHAIPVGINAGYHGFSTEDFAFCPAMLRSPHTSGASLRAFMAAAPVDCPVLALVEAPDVALAVALSKEHPRAIELGNELELQPFELTPEQYGKWIFDAVTALKTYDGVIVLGGVFAVRDETKPAITLGIEMCAAAGRTCVVGVHLYDASDEDLQWLRNLNTPVWVTEVGMPTRCQPARLEQQKDYLTHQIARFSTVPQLQRVFIYQRISGSSCSDLDTFGIAGKPAEDILRKWWAR